MLNVTAITGRLVRDPELRYTSAQTPVTSVSIAVKREYIREGEPEADFFDIVAWRQTAEFICKYFKKGSLISVVGSLQNRHWTDKHDQNRVTTEISVQKAHFSESKGKDGNNENDDVIEPFEYDEAPVDNGAAEVENSTPPPPAFDPFE